MKILSEIIHPVVPTSQDFCSSSEHKLRYFLLKSESSIFIKHFSQYRLHQSSFTVSIKT